MNDTLKCIYRSLWALNIFVRAFCGGKYIRYTGYINDFTGFDVEVCDKKSIQKNIADIQFTKHCLLVHFVHIAQFVSTSRSTNIY